RDAQRLVLRTNAPGACPFEHFPARVNVRPSHSKRFRTEGRDVSNPLTTRATALFREAAGQGRDSLEGDRLNELLGELGLALDADTGAGGAGMRITLNSTREFGMVIGAGFGGLEAELDESQFRRDRASVYAAAELTDAADF